VASTTNTVEALTEDVFAVTERFPLAAAGIVMPVLNAPVDVVWNWKAAEPTVTVPVAEALKPVPETVTAEPAGPDPGFTVTSAAGAAMAGCRPDRTIPVPTKKAMTNVLKVFNKTTHPQLTGGRGRKLFRCKAHSIKYWG
jgi:hypothetical protein